MINAWRHGRAARVKASSLPSSLKDLPKFFSLDPLLLNIFLKLDRAPKLYVSNLWGFMTWQNSGWRTPHMCLTLRPVPMTFIALLQSKNSTLQVFPIKRLGAEDQEKFCLLQTRDIGVNMLWKTMLNTSSTLEVGYSVDRWLPCLFFLGARYTSRNSKKYWVKKDDKEKERPKRKAPPKNDGNSEQPKKKNKKKTEKAPAKRAKWFVSPDLCGVWFKLNCHWKLSSYDQGHESCPPVCFQELCKLSGSCNLMIFA